MSQKLLLVAGATGKQGHALINALNLTSQSQSSNEFIVWALTRTKSSPAAQTLASQYPQHLTLIQCNLDAPDEVRQVFEDAKREKGGVWGVFCVLAFPGLGASTEGEERQGKTLADLSAEFGVSSFIYTSSERGGEYYDDHRAKADRLSKVMIERHVRALGESKGLPWTILRPGFFMENYEGTIGAITVGVLKSGLQATTKVQMVAVDDIGQVAARIFMNPQQHNRQIFAIVGECSTMAEQDESYRRATGYALPAIPSFLAWPLLSLNTHVKSLIADLERVHSARSGGELCPEVEGQIAAAREVYPGMRAVEMWAKETKEKEKVHGGNGSVSAGWNQVSILKLITGRQ
ncbi:NmrA-like family domain-containing protein 1 [Favolaschia claudopus]|uniref:NmrA-like family domain-containing protein 1 n=1 Tax=Favolaschia claudopus TaxID=2862362 RepID=A0AAV9ZIK3_9AGAR